MKALCRDCLHGFAAGGLAANAGALPRLRLAAPHRPCRARRSRHRPYRLRRLLCQRREARRSLPQGQAGHRRRRTARRRLGGLLHRPALWRALGHADVQGAGRLPQCRGRHPRHGEIFAGGRRDPRDDALPHPAGGAALHRRGLSRSRRDIRAASRQPGAQPGAPGAGGRAAHRRHRLHRPQLQQIPGQDRLGPRQAPRLRADRARRGGRLPRPQAGRPHLGRGQGAPGPAGGRRHRHHRRSQGRPGDRARRPLRQHRPPALPFRPGRGRSPGRPRRRDEEHLGGNDLRRGYRQRRASGGRALAALREGLPADEALWPAGPEHPPQAQDLGFQDPDPFAPAARGRPSSPRRSTRRPCRC